VTDAADRLAVLLRAELPADVAALPDATLERFATQVEAARARQDRIIADAVETAIAGVPLPVRGVVKKTLRG